MSISSRSCFSARRRERHRRRPVARAGRQVMAMAANGLVLAALFMALQAPDVAFSELAVGTAPCRCCSSSSSPACGWTADPRQSEESSSSPAVTPARGAFCSGRLPVRAAGPATSPGACRPSAHIPCPTATRSTPKPRRAARHQHGQRRQLRLSRLRYPGRGVHAALRRHRRHVLLRGARGEGLSHHPAWSDGRPSPPQRRHDADLPRRGRAHPAVRPLRRAARHDHARRRLPGWRHPGLRRPAHLPRRRLPRLAPADPLGSMDACEGLGATLYALCGLAAMACGEPFLPTSSRSARQATCSPAA